MKEGVIVLQSVTLATGQFVDQFRKEFTKEYHNLLKNGVPISLQEDYKGGFVFLDFNFNEQAIAKPVLRRYLVSSISDFIFNHWEKQLVQAIIAHDYGALNPPERDYVFSKSIQRLVEMDKLIEYSKMSSRKKDMCAKIQKFLEDNAYINIDGFIQFRNKEYLQELRKIIDCAAEEFYIDQEYYEFINLLKSLIEWQEPKVENIHVVFLPSGGFQLFDNYNKVIDRNYLDGFLLDFEEGVINYDDLLISSLINISPSNVILHITKQNNNYPEMIKIIFHVFEKRVTVCEGCERCINLEQHKKN